MNTPADATGPAAMPAVLKIAAGIWLILGGIGTVWTLLGLLLVLAFGGMVAPATYLPALALYLASGAVFVMGIVLVVLLRRGARWARIVLTALAVILPALLFVRGGPFVGEVPWQQVLLSPVGGVGVAAVAATVLMWLPPSNRFFARRAVNLAEKPADSGSGRMPQSVAAAAWILVVAGVVATLQAALGLALLAGFWDPAANVTPALVLWLTLAAVAAADIACAREVRRGKPFVRPLVTIIPPAGLGLIALAAVAGTLSLDPGNPPAPGGLGAAVLLAILSQGLPLIAGLVAAVLVWLPASGPHFRRAGDAVPAAPAGPGQAALPPAPG
ncbi:hypothetical protein [Pseudarthrobacter sp. 1C304]|uniref:hypothetical protein n=1 Tax=Pseudarthrobacter sp. 1C304 TaxID=3457438 RepID=UPI003FD574AF